MQINMALSGIVSLFGTMVILVSIPSINVLTIPERSAISRFVHGFFKALRILEGDIIFTV